MPARINAIGQHPLLTSFGILLAGTVALALSWDWNWLNTIVARQISEQLDRPVSLVHFDIRDLWTAHPLVVLDGVTVGNPPNFPEGSDLGSIDRLSFRIDTPALLSSQGGDIVLSEVGIEHPKGDLRPGPKGNPNWVFDLPGGGDGAPPRIGSLVITDGNFRVAAPKLKADLTMAVHTENDPHGGEARLVIAATGTYAAQPFTAHFTGGSLLSLRDPKKPYPVDLVAKAGPTAIALKGTIEDPMQLAGANLQLELAGQDLSDLNPIFGIPLAPTPPFRLRGHLEYSANGNHIKFSKFAGTVGQSDLEGDFDVDRGYQPPLVTADLSSNRVVLADLAGFIGGAPGKKDSPSEGARQVQQHAREEAKPTLLPDQPINLAALRSTNYRLHYKGRRIVSDWTPLDNLEANLVIDNGKLSLKPLTFGVGNGTIASTVMLDARVDPIHADASIDFRHVDFHRLMQATNTFEGVGQIGGSAKIDARGNSLAKMLAGGNGDLKLYMTGGNIDAILVDLAGLDFGRTLMAALGLPDKADIRCMASRFGLEKGVLRTHALVFDTDEANIVGKGTVNLANEAIDYQVSQEPKHLSIGALHTPIDITGTMKDPHVKPNPAQLGARLGVAAALGVLFPPAALLPTIQLGTGEDHNCDELIRAALH